MLLKKRVLVNLNITWIPTVSARIIRVHTETALLKLTNDVLQRMDRQSITILCAIDLLAAFDTVDHEILLSVLGRTFMVGDTALQWFDSYLRPCTLKVNVNGSY